MRGGRLEGVGGGGKTAYEQPGNFFFFFGPPSVLPQDVNHCFSRDHLLHTTHHPLLQRAASQIMAGKSTNGWKIQAGGGLLRKLAKESLDLRISLGGMAVALWCGWMREQFYTYGC